MKEESIFQNKSYLLLVLTLFFTAHGFQIQFVALSWQIYLATKDPLSLGFIGLAEASSFLIVCFLGGIIADRFHRKMLSIIALSGQILCGLLYLYFTFKFTNLKSHQIYFFYGVTFLKGIFRGLYQPAFNAIASEVVSPHLISKAAAFRASAWHIAFIVGPSIGGLILGATNIFNTYMTALVLLSIGLICISFVQYQPKKNSNSKESILKSLSQGVNFVFGHKIILTSISLDLFSVLFGGAIALLPVYASDILKVGPEGLGYLKAAPGLGALVMSIYCTKFPIKSNIGMKLIISVFCFGLSMLFFGITKSFFMSLISLFLSGFFDTISVIIRSLIIQTYTPQNLMGRVMSVNLIFIGSSNELGAFESGIAARILGVVPSVVFGSFLTLLIVIFTYLKVGDLKRLDSIE